jgi:nitrous oxide reductase
MDTNHPPGRRRGKALLAAALVAAALTIGGAITATAATDHEPTQAQAGGPMGLSHPGDYGYFGFGW